MNKPGWPWRSYSLPLRITLWNVCGLLFLPSPAALIPLKLIKQLQASIRCAPWPSASPLGTAPHSWCQPYLTQRCASLVAPATHTAGGLQCHDLVISIVSPRLGTWALLLAVTNRRR